YEFLPENIPENIRYYNKITSNGSTLSQIINAWVSSRSHRELSWYSFRQALLSDFQDVQGGTTPEGIHLGAMAGTVDIIQRCYTGMEVRDAALWFNPLLPQEIKELSFRIRYRSHLIHVRLNQKKIYIAFDKGWGEPIRIIINGVEKTFDKKEAVEIDYS